MNSQDEQPKQHYHTRVLLIRKAYAGHTHRHRKLSRISLQGSRAEDSKKGHGTLQGERKTKPREISIQS